MKMKLGDFLLEVNERTTRNNEYPVLTASKECISLQNQYFKKPVASKDNTGYKVIHRGQFTYRAMSDTGNFYPNILESVNVGIVSPAYPVFEITNKELVLPKYLKYYFKSPVFQFGISKFVQGTTRANLHFNKMKTIEIDVPSVDEQYEVVNCLSKVTSLMEKKKKEIVLLNTMLKARFVEMFGDENKHVLMRDICSIITDGTHQPPKFVDKGIPFIFVSNITGNEITYDAEKFINQETYDELMKRTPLEIGDIILSTVGSYGHPAIVKSNRKFLFQRHIAYLKPRKEMIDSEYLHSAILTDDVQRQIDAAVKGIAQKTLNLSAIKELEIPLPPISGQKEFVSFKNQVNKSKTNFNPFNFLP